MRKVKLEIDSLRVESFDAAPSGMAGRGTVRGHDYTEVWEGCPERQTKPQEYTCGVSCLGPCQHTMEVPDCGVGTDFGCV